MFKELESIGVHITNREMIASPGINQTVFLGFMNISLNVTFDVWNQRLRLMPSSDGKIQINMFNLRLFSLGSVYAATIMLADHFRGLYFYWANVQSNQVIVKQGAIIVSCNIANHHLFQSSIEVSIACYLYCVASSKRVLHGNECTASKWEIRRRCSPINLLISIQFSWNSNVFAILFLKLIK